jgi:spore germination protein GerM
MDAQASGMKMIDPALIKSRWPFFRYLGFFIIGFTMIVLCRTAGADVSNNGLVDEPLASEVSTPSHKVQAHLYFANRDYSFLKSEQRVVDRIGEPVEFGRAIVEALIKGPQRGLIRTIPTGTELKAIYIATNRVCYVDFSEAVRNNHPGGSNSEMLTIYSVVNSLILNVSEIKQVKILIEGSESATLAGHITLQFPFKAHMLMIR